ncbi:MAG: hypothetical protein ACYTHJ_06565, partial [Planctomycetota bacterium]
MLMALMLPSRCEPAGKFAKAFKLDFRRQVDRALFRRASVHLLSGDIHGFTWHTKIGVDVI